MKISVVIPLYNKEKTILRAVASVLNQSEQDFELIVVDDGSTDSSYALVSSLADNLKIRLIHQDNAGVSAARNRGVAEAKSDLIAFLDADDEWLSEFLETILKLQSQFPDADVFGTGYYFQDQDGVLRFPKTNPLFETNKFMILDNYLEILRIGLPFNSSSFAITRKAFDEIGGFPLGIQFGEDVDFWIRLSLIYKIAYINTPMLIYHLGEENSACDLYYPFMREYYPVNNLVNMIKERQVPARLRQSAIEYIAKYQLAFASSYLYDGDSIQARKLIRTSFGTKIYIGKWFFLYACTFLSSTVLQLLIKIRNSVKARLA